MKHLPVAEGHTIPALGLGTWKSNKGEVAAAVSEAITIGYRHIDCAPIYMNEQEVGTALNGALQAGRVKRDELWITSKLWNNAHAKKHVRPALEKTLQCGEAVYWSRSRNRLWHKGEESGHIQKIVDIRLDCDNDALLFLVEQTGLACHTGRLSCFYQHPENTEGNIQWIAVDPVLKKPSEIYK